MAGHVNYRKPGTRNVKSVSQFNPGHATELDVQEKTINLACNPAPDKFFCRFFCRQKIIGCKSLSIQQLLSGPEHVCVVIDNSYDSLSHRHQHLVGRLDALAWLVPLPHRALRQNHRSRRPAHWGRSHGGTRHVSSLLSTRIGNRLTRFLDSPAVGATRIATGQQPEPFGQDSQLCERMNLQFLNKLMSMELNGPL
jgi:hypothetical protein